MRIIESEYHPIQHINRTERLAWAVELDSEEGRLFVIDPARLRVLLGESSTTAEGIFEKLGFGIDGLEELVLMAIPKDRATQSS